MSAGFSTGRDSIASRMSPDFTPASSPGPPGATSAALTPSAPATQRMPSSTSFQVARRAMFARPRPSSVATNVADTSDRTHPGSLPPAAGRRNVRLHLLETQTITPRPSCISIASRVPVLRLARATASLIESIICATRLRDAFACRFNRPDRRSNLSDTQISRRRNTVGLDFPSDSHAIRSLEAQGEPADDALGRPGDQSSS